MRVRLKMCITNIFTHLAKQEPTASGPATLDNLQKAFAANNCHIQKLMIDIALVATEIK